MALGAGWSRGLVAPALFGVLALSCGGRGISGGPSNHDDGGSSGGGGHSTTDGATTSGFGGASGGASGDGRPQPGTDAAIDRPTPPVDGGVPDAVPDSGLRPWRDA